MGALAVLAALAYLGVRILQGWRMFKRFRRHLAKELGPLADAGERTAEAAARATDTTELDQSLGRLRVTLARFALLREALDEATGAFGRSHRRLPAQVRVAAVDLGTNTTRLLVADVEDGRLEEVHRETRITRLGEGVDARGRLLPVPIARVRNALTDYRQTLEQLGAERTLAVATSAVRDAENGEAFLGEVEWSYGFTTQLLSGDDEARLTRRGVDPNPETLVVDIGGGSTELIVDDFHTSLDIGSVRYTERFIHTDPPDPRELEECARSARAMLDERVHANAQTAIGVAGTVTTLAALDLNLQQYDRDRVHGHRLTTDAARTQLARLAALPLQERRDLPAVEPERAPVIVAGAVILVAILEHFSLDEIEVSERDILDGIALAAAELPEPEEGAAPPGAYTCC